MRPHVRDGHDDHDDGGVNIPTWSVLRCPSSVVIRGFGMRPAAQVLNVRIEIDAGGKFTAKVRSNNIRAPLGLLILHIDELTHLFPDTPKHVALSYSGINGV